MWRPSRDEDGWKLIRLAAQKVAMEHGDPPKFVDAASRLASSQRFGSPPTAPNSLQSTTSKKGSRYGDNRSFYGFGDASKTEFCTNFEIERAIQSSNYRKLKRFVDGLEQQIKARRIVGAEVILFTDSSTAEAVHYKGNSLSRKLFDLVLHL